MLKVGFVRVACKKSPYRLVGVVVFSVNKRRTGRPLASTPECHQPNVLDIGANVDIGTFCSRF